MPNSKSRRRFLLSAGAAGMALSGYSYQRGIRFPTIAWEPHALPTRFEFDQWACNTDGLISTPADNLDARFRAYIPEPSLSLQSNSSQRIRLSVGNIASDAEMLFTGSATITEKTDGITRHLVINCSRDETFSLSWKLPRLMDYTFASIGDSGGDLELAWCIQRAHALGARFLLHLGDFNYQAGDYKRSIDLFNNSPIPCYVSIGNHDFHDSGLLYNRFRREIGPLNSNFSIGKTRFANIDTAANTLPYSAGHRGTLFKQLINDNQSYADTVAFTHRPLHDPTSESTHDIGSTGERDWLIESLKLANINTLLSGHIHIFDRSEFQGIDNIIVGQGLGHQDLIVNQDHSVMAIGQVNQDGIVDYSFKPLAMPMEIHCHPRSDVVKESLTTAPHAKTIQEIDQACLKRS